MIRSPLRAGIALACALSLSACGGGDGDVFVGGAVSGNTKAGLVVTNNDGPRLEIGANQGSFTFPELVETDAGYNVKVVAAPDNTQPSDPANPASGCRVLEGTGSGKAIFNISSVRIICTLKSYKLTARINGAHGAGLELINGSDRKLVKPEETSVEMAPIPEGAVYGLAVLASPSGQTCTVPNPAGTMTIDGKIVDVNCTTP